MARVLRATIRSPIANELAHGVSARIGSAVRPAQCPYAGESRDDHRRNENDPAHPKDGLHDRSPMFEGRSAHRIVAITAGVVHTKSGTAHRKITDCSAAKCHGTQ